MGSGREREGIEYRDAPASIKGRYLIFASVIYYVNDEDV